MISTLRAQLSFANAMSPFLSLAILRNDLNVSTTASLTCIVCFQEIPSTTITSTGTDSDIHDLLLLRCYFLSCVLNHWPLLLSLLLLALSGRIIRALTARVAYSPPFSVDPFVSLVRSLGGGGGLAMEAHLVAAGSIPVLWQ
ncbi:MYB-like transcription factor ETC3 [Pyrus ussuriensis x Pyrus communis]|uniref:MYB-like transcription factor ETC3 n=1 Tax=Pyrus ussuriensis x Pyrus communis TaxID=2448454 RepID=A0A5N5FMM7_9ROSA|nr:MYB-like transcription factor ETC3 [Pyrus ussuriensis x Pyrus communis]